MYMNVKISRQYGTNVEEARSIVKIGNKRKEKKETVKQEAIETRLTQWRIANLTANIWFIAFMALIYRVERILNTILSFSYGMRRTEKR